MILSTRQFETIDSGPEDTTSSVMWAGAGNAIGYIELVSSCFFARIFTIVDLDSHIAMRPAELALVQCLSS